MERTPVLLPLLVAVVAAAAPSAGASSPGPSVAGCEKYAGAVYQTKPSPVLLPGSNVDRVNTCAMKGVPLVVGGEVAEVNEFPHMALLGYQSRREPQWQCGGSLISDRYVLTAAHCLETNAGPPLVVRLGERDLWNDNEPKSKHEDFGVEKLIPHPQYKKSEKYDDMALIRLDRDVKFTASIRPACLNTLREIADANATGTGWGVTDPEDATETSNLLMKVKIPLQGGKLCGDRYRRWASLPNGYEDDKMLCAGDLAGGKDTCQGDSGGPLQTKHNAQYCMYNIVGVTNFGPKCGTPNFPAVYARVSYYIPWIESIVWPQGV